MKTKLSKRVFSIMMSIFIILSLLPSITIKVHAVDLNGNGNSTISYQIKNADELVKFSNIVHESEGEF